MTINPNEAPEGYYAAPTEMRGPCVGCAFYCPFDPNKWKFRECYTCHSSTRKDRREVIFKKRDAFREGPEAAKVIMDLQAKLDDALAKLEGEKK